MTAKLLAYRTEDGIVDAQTGEIMDETDERLEYFQVFDNYEAMEIVILEETK